MFHQQTNSTSYVPSTNQTDHQVAFQRRLLWPYVSVVPLHTRNNKQDTLAHRVHQFDLGSAWLKYASDATDASLPSLPPSLWSARRFAALVDTLTCYWFSHSDRKNKSAEKDKYIIYIHTYVCPTLLGVPFVLKTTPKDRK